MSTLLLSPHHDCKVTARDCPLLRICPCCGVQYATERGRMYHQPHCARPFSVDAAEVQHLHRVLFHQPPRQRRRTRKG